MQSDANVKTARVGTILIVATDKGIEAIDTRDGNERWRLDGVEVPVAGGNTVYVSRNTENASVPALVALDPRSGAIRWQRSHAGGELDAGDNAVAVANRSGVSLYSADGRLRWRIPKQDGGYTRVIISGPHVVTLSEREGAILHGELESIDRGTGRLIGSTVYFGDLLSLDNAFAIGDSDFPGDLDEMCRSAEVFRVSLDRTGPHGLDRTSETFQLEGEHPKEQCNRLDGSGAHPYVSLDGDFVVLAYGTVVSRSRRGATQGPVSVLYGTRLIGGPFAGKYFVTRKDGLDALQWIGAQPRFTHLLSSRGNAPISVAGLGTRLYASDGRSLIAFDTVTWSERERFEFGCSGLRAVARFAASDLLACGSTTNGGNTADLVALSAP